MQDMNQMWTGLLNSASVTVGLISILMFCAVALIIFLTMCLCERREDRFSYAEKNTASPSMRDYAPLHPIF